MMEKKLVVEVSTNIKWFTIYLCFFVSLIMSELAAEPSQTTTGNGIYIVYMGASTAPRRDPAQLLLNTLKRKAVVRSYKHGFSGFAARLSEEEAHSIAQKPGVVSVFPDPLLQLHTTRSWDFLKYQTDLKIDSSESNSSSHQSDTVIGILDTGIWPEAESFNDKDMEAIPARWNGTCMKGRNFDSSNCNRKLIGARYYIDPGSEPTDYQTPRDLVGHGTHVAATAAGNAVPGASYYGLAVGTAKGGNPGSRIAVYRVCTPIGCRGSSILAAFDDAISDGVDVLSLSLGSSAAAGTQFSVDPIAIGAFHAFEKGITVVCSAGNDGPDDRTVVNVAPWIFTVAATSIDRDFESNVVLGGNKIIKGGGINFADIQRSPVYPLIYGSAAKRNSGTSTEDDARNCLPESLDGDKIKGKIILCENKDYEYSPREKLQEVKRLGGVGLILIDDDVRAVVSTYGSFPMTAVTLKDGADILSYINSNSNPVGTILATVSVTEYKPAPNVAYFSARGPSYITRNLLKPDIAAPGVNILAAWPGNDTSAAFSGMDPAFNLLSGTSMSCPHVSGIVATVKALNPKWSPSAIRSAIMTTASQTNNLKTPITTNFGSIATPYDYGAGEVNTVGSSQPGLVFETETIDYLQFLCNNGYDITKIKLLSSTIPSGFSCPSNSSADLISNMNYPSIAISNFKAKVSRTVIRTVTNVGEDETNYSATVDAPSGLDVKVIPDKLIFTKDGKKLSYQVIFTSGAPKDEMFGSITWTNGKYKVRSPFVVTTEQ
ncbi:hypothetical protein LguiB_020205 [Lonicera macranthoides]